MRYTCEDCDQEVYLSAMTDSFRWPDDWFPAVMKGSCTCGGELTFDGRTA